MKKLGQLMMVGAVLGMLLPVSAFAYSNTDDALYAGRGRRARKAAVKPAPKKPVNWVYMAQRMRPPKNDKWKTRWNDLGLQGWELVAAQDNYYIFKRPSDYPVPAPVMPAEPKAEDAPKKKK